MAQDQTKKEALFNEVKGSLFEYLVGKEIALRNHNELAFQNTLDENYLKVLAQQDRMVRQFYPEMMSFLSHASHETTESLINWFGELPELPRITGKFSNSPLHAELNEADLLMRVGGKLCPVSLKLNKKNAFVNTKSGGIKSFFTQYFPFINPMVQEKFNQLVDLEFERMSLELHALHDLEYRGNYSSWIKAGLSELPGEVSPEARVILKSYYARLAQEMHNIFSEAQRQDPSQLALHLCPLMGFSSPEIVQVVCFHDFKGSDEINVNIHSVSEIREFLNVARINEFGGIASVEIEVGNWILQVRVKPMNKFTTTAIKINCSVKVTRPASAGG